MTKQQNTVYQGEIIEALPNTMFKVRLDSGQDILTVPAGRVRRGSLRLLPGVYVKVEVTPYDENRGRIVGRGDKKKERQDYES